ncbi:MAG: FHA domain-containing protein [Planctomycetota bacterium]|nr:FHA domain-containing protein [Planctomycetota bacterium]
MDVKLVIARPDGSSKEITVKPGRYIVGRRPDAELRIPLPTVSRDHCEIIHDGSSLSVRDLGSSNGTFKNNERIQKASLGAGDILGVGSFQMTVIIDGRPPESKGSAHAAAVSRPDPDEEDEDILINGPGPRAGSVPPGSLAETVQRSSSPASRGASDDDSSVFEFDFDFEDDDRPRL